MTDFDNIKFERKPVNFCDVKKTVDVDKIPDIFLRIFHDCHSLFGMDEDPAYLFTKEFPYPASVDKYFTYHATNGDRYFVNTEGYNYMRYVVRIVEPKMLEGAKCPNCMTPWYWDWCQDGYRYADGDFVEVGKHVAQKSESTREEVTLYICKCGSVNSTELFVNGETLMTYTLQWKDIDWELEGAYVP